MNKFRILMILSTLTACAIAEGNSSAQLVDAITLTPSLGTVQRPIAFAVDGNRTVYAVDDLTNRLFVLEAGHKIVKVIGHIGPGPGQLFHADGIALSPSSIVILDAGNGRVQFLSRSGEFKSQYPLFGPLIRGARGFAVDGDNHAYINYPHSDHLLNVYSPDGTLAHTVGSATTVSKLYNSTDRSRDRQFKEAANSVWVTLDQDQCIYVTFLIAPVVRKYARDGHLEFETRLSGPEANRLTNAFWRGDQNNNPRLLKTSIDGTETKFITRAISFDRARRRIYVLAGSDNVFELTSEGKQLRVLPINNCDSTFLLWKMAVSEGEALFNSIVSTGICGGTIPPDTQPGMR